MKKIITTAILVILIITFYVIYKTSNWNSSEKISYLKLEKSGDVKVFVIDPQLAEKTEIIIPADTQVEVSRNYGFMRIKNVWQLGVNEKIGGKLLTETVTKNFQFPVIYWWNDDTTNLSRIDRIKLSLYMKKLNSVDENDIDMGKNGYLKKVKLEDNEDGYKLIGTMSKRLTAYFSDTKLDDKNIKIKIVDSSNKAGVAEGLGVILEVIGGKVVSYEKAQIDDNLDCNVGGTNSDAIKNVNKYFGCKITKFESNYDLDVRIGKKFALRF